MDSNNEVSTKINPENPTELNQSPEKNAFKFKAPIIHSS